MEFGWPDAHTELFDRTLEFSKSLNRDLEKRIAAHRLDVDAWRAIGAFGLLGVHIPEAFGGMGLSAQETAHLMEAFGEGCEDQGLVFSVGAHLFAVAAPILEHGNDLLKQRYLPAMCAGKCIGANAITEAEAGSDVLALTSSATKDGDDYVLNGVKSYVTNGPVADVFLVYAKTDASLGYFGLSAFLVERGRQGLTVGTPFEKVGLSTSPISSLYLSDVRVPATHRLGAEGQGALQFKSSMLWERACLFAGYVGAMNRQLARTIEFTRTRKQFKKPLSANQVVAHKLARLRMQIDAARLLVFRACWLRDQGKDATGEIAMAKVAVSEAAVQVGLDTAHLHGGTGVVTDHGIDRLLRDALPSQIFSGTNEVQLDLLAKTMGL
jgi:alkylation response protein AidB-like acyl-CoA dehydrogenase